MIPSIDTHVYEQLNKRIKAILEECYIIDEALKDFDEETRKDFKDTFCGKKPKKRVLLSYQYPQANNSFEAMYVIQLGSGEETDKAIGGVEGAYDYRQTGVRREVCDVLKDDETGRLMFQVTDPIGDIEGIEGISFAESDDVQVSGREITFNYDPLLENLKGFTIIYTAKDDTESPKLSGVIKGFTSTENLTVVGLSYNYDTARCLDAILKVIVISMRESIPEKTYYGLQTVSFASMQPVIEDAERPIFGRPVSLGYRVSYGVDFDFTTEINKVITRRRVSNESKS